MKNRNRKGFTIIEVIAAVAITAVIMTCVVWNITGLKKMANEHLAINRAVMITTAKDAFLREQGAKAMEEFEKRKSDEERFALIKRFLPYSNTDTTLANYTPRGFEFAMNDLGKKVGIMAAETRKPIRY